MTPFKLPLLRDAGRLDMLELPALPDLSDLSRQAREEPVAPGIKIRHRPLERDPRIHRDPLLGRLAADWSCLGQARRDTPTLTALLRILAMTASSGAHGPCHAPPFGGGRDLRAWISDQEVQQRWLYEMRQHWRAAVMPLIAQGLLPVWAAACVPEADGSFCLDVYQAARFGERRSLGDTPYQHAFSRTVLPFLPAKAGLAEVREWERLHQTLPYALQRDGAISKLAQRGAPAAAWLELAVHGGTVETRELLGQLVRLQAELPEPPRGTRGLLMTIRHAAGLGTPSHLLRWALRGLSDGISPKWMKGALRLSLQTGEVLPDAHRTPHIPDARHILAFARQWKKTDSWVWPLWRAACRHPGLGAMLRDLSPRRWSERSAAALVQWLMQFGREKQKARRSGRWQALQTHWREILGLLHGLRPLHRKDLLSLLLEGLCDPSLEKDPDLAGDTLKWARVARAVYAMDPTLRVGLLAKVMPYLGTVGRQHLAAHLAGHMLAVKKLSPALFFELHLDSGAACIPRLGRHVCLYLVWREPRLFLRTLELLGQLSLEAADRVVEVFVEHPLTKCRPNDCSLKELMVMVESVSPGRKHGIRPKERLKAHLSGAKPQPPHLVEADRHELLQAWARISIEVLEDLVHRELRLMYPLFRETQVPQDTLLYLHTMLQDRRKGCQMIRRHVQSGFDPKAGHPANRQWLATLPAATATAWTDGLIWTREVPDLGAVTLEVERNPLEVLRMGEYGHSCLASGGNNQHAALTNAMEANKQVVYARTASGRVVGRQLMALTESRTLLCFMVYPLSCPVELDDVFRDYDEARAAQLGVPLEHGKEYNVAAPLGLEWYDDGVWVPPARNDKT